MTYAWTSTATGFPKGSRCGHPLQSPWDACPNPDCHRAQKSALTPEQPANQLADAIQNLASAIAGLSQVVGATKECQGDEKAADGVVGAVKDVRPSSERMVFTDDDLRYCLKGLPWTLSSGGRSELAHEIQNWIDAKVNS